MVKRQVRLSGDQYQILRTHLFPGDGREAVALALCGRIESPTAQVLCVHKLLLIPHDQCRERTPIRVSWPANLGQELYVEAMNKHMAVLKIHSHPTTFEDFSSTDNFSDQDLFASLHGWTDDGLPHGSAVMMQGGDMIARFITPNLEFQPVDSVMVAGDDIQIFYRAEAEPLLAAAHLRTAQAFGEKTVRLLSALTVAVVGCSGTGSWIVEQLHRLGVGRVIMIDPDVVEHKNLNRIINSRRKHADAAEPKVNVLADAVRATGLVREVISIQDSCFSPSVIKLLAECDVIFGCMDCYDGRQLLNRIATFYCQPLFDIGVHLQADGQGGVTQVCGSVHYLLPGGSSLLSRGVYTPEDLRVAALRRTDPEQFREEIEAGYIKGARVESPAVVSVNGLCATLAINNFLARIHPYRIGPNSEIRWQTFDLVNSALTANADGDPCKILARYIGRGDMNPLLNCTL